MSKWTLTEVLVAAKEYLAKQKLTSPQLEAELLLAHSLELTRVELYVQYDRPLKEEEREKFKRVLKERCAGKPLQYITGNQAFRRLNLRVGDGVFIPRPETELLVEKVIDEIGFAAASSNSRLMLLDLGAGAGTICLALAEELEDADIWAVDISEKSLAVAEANAIAHGLENKVTFICGDLFSALPRTPAMKFDAIVANPPYIPSAQIDTLQAEVKNHEPREALDGGATGMDFYRRITERASQYLEDRGLIAFEVGIDQSVLVSDLLVDSGFPSIDTYEDYNGIKRVIIGRRHSNS